MATFKSPRAKPSQAHIPKRATQNGIFLSGSEVSPPCLKPGQQDLHRQDLYTQEAKPVARPYMFQDQFADSHYATHIAKITLPEDYSDPVAAMRPPTVTAHGAGGTDHWVSEYKASLNEYKGTKSKEAELGKPWFPYEDFGNGGVLDGRGGMNSSYQEEFGKYRSNPRDKIGVSNKKTMDAGTTKGTKHIPGYQGFVPGNTFSEEVARVENGDFSRSVDKTNIEQTFHSNIIGYSGHVPSSALNHRGAREITARTVYGHDYPDPKSLVLACGKEMPCSRTKILVKQN